MEFSGAVSSCDIALHYVCGRNVYTAPKGSGYGGLGLPQTSLVPSPPPSAIKRRAEVGLGTRLAPDLLLKADTPPIVQEAIWAQNVDTPPRRNQKRFLGVNFG